MSFSSSVRRARASASSAPPTSQTQPPAPPLAVPSRRGPVPTNLSRLSLHPISDSSPSTAADQDSLQHCPRHIARLVKPALSSSDPLVHPRQHRRTINPHSRVLHAVVAPASLCLSSTHLQLNPASASPHPLAVSPERPPPHHRALTTTSDTLRSARRTQPSNSDDHLHPHRRSSPSSPRQAPTAPPPAPLAELRHRAPPPSCS